MRTEITLQSTLKQQLMPQMLQHLNILQLTTVELAELVQRKSLENPLIDLVESPFESPYDWLQLEANKASANQVDYDLLFVQQSSVRDFLVEQIPLTVENDEKVILRYLIDSLDERLFLSVTAEEISHQFKISLLKAQELIRILQSFEPVGVGASDMTQFLIMHIDVKEEVPCFAKEFVIHEKKAMAKMDVLNLSKRYNISVDEVLQTIEFIKCLPRTPAITLEALSPYFVPDASVYKIGEQWIVELENKKLPKVKLHDIYVEILKNDHQEYFQDCMRDYMTLVQGIDFRNQTLYAVINYIVERQSQFLEKGKGALKPMRLKDIAEALDLHESTISRAVKGKYLHTTFGNVALQELFVKSVGNSTTSSICELIASLIDKEPKNAPYSDQQLVDLLKKKGVQISRRTVAKYREQLNIPSSQKRAHLLVVE